MRVARPVLSALCLFVAAAAACAQNPVQWQGNPSAAVEHAREQMLPLMVWVWDSTDSGRLQRRSDTARLRDAQENAFRDPSVVWLAHNRFVPLRLMRNSRTNAVLQELGLPTEHGLYIAVVTADKQLLDRIGMEETADPAVLASRLVAASDKFNAGLYERELRPIITNPTAQRATVRRALRAVWRLRITSADVDVVALLKREDLTPAERSRLYALLAALGTPAAVNALLDVAPTDADAASALARAHATAVQTLVGALPTCGQAPSERQLAAYNALVRLVRAGTARPTGFWTESPAAACEAELTRLRDRADTVLEFARSREGLPE